LRNLDPGKGILLSEGVHTRFREIREDEFRTGVLVN
jgi:hypothetical protein